MKSRTDIINALKQLRSDARKHGMSEDLLKPLDDAINHLLKEKQDTFKDTSEILLNVANIANHFVEWFLNSS